MLFSPTITPASRVGVCVADSRLLSFGPVMASYFFSEMPYAAILSAGYLSTHCSNCFSKRESMKACNHGCEEAVYCTDGCMESDRPWHECECLAYRNGRSRPEREYSDAQVRLSGRIIARLRKDQGKAVLSDDFPRHLAKDRQFSRLLGHSRELRKLPSYRELTNSLADDFAKFFSGTPLGDVKPSQVTKILDVSKINGFSIASISSDNPQDLLDLGEGVYLNVSRFNHSCDPDIFFSFCGSRLIVRLIEKEEPGNGDGSSVQSSNKLKSRAASMSKKEFKGLKFNYGFGSSWNHYSALSCTYQRRKSLKDRYFFTCRCTLCRDKRRAALEQDASTIECQSCKLPYVWQKRKDTDKWRLKKLCDCQARDKNLPEWIRDPEIQRNVDCLYRSWEHAMLLSSGAKDSSTITNALKSMFPLAKTYWHPVWNLRLGQTYEKVMYAWECKMFELSKDEQPFVDELKSLLIAGEAMLKIYLKHASPWDLATAVIMHRMSIRYLRLKDDDGSNSERASHLCKAAAEIWRRYGEIGCQKFLLNRAQAIENGDSQVGESGIE